VEEAQVILVGIDPGKKATGWALFRSGVLEGAGIVRGENVEVSAIGVLAAGVALRSAGCLRPDVVIIEKMVVYPGMRQKGDQNDLITLSIIGGAAAAALRGLETIFVEPREWKGQVPKAIMSKRILAELSADERTKIEKMPASLKHNALDAVGLGMWNLGRIGRNRR
jgi:hypothetical protein